VEIGPVVSVENILIEIVLHVHVVVWRRMYWTNFLYESALRADDGSVPYFPICQGSLPWQPNNVAVLKANWYYVHSLHVR